MPTNGGCIHIDGCTCYARLQAHIEELETEREEHRQYAQNYKALAERLREVAMQDGYCRLCGHWKETRQGFHALSCPLTATPEEVYKREG